MKDKMGHEELILLFSYVYSRLALGTLLSSIHQKSLSMAFNCSSPPMFG